MTLFYDLPEIFEIVQQVHSIFEIYYNNLIYLNRRLISVKSLYNNKNLIVMSFKHNATDDNNTKGHSNFMHKT